MSTGPGTPTTRGWFGNFVDRHPTLIDTAVAGLWAMNYALSYLIFPSRNIAIGTWVLLPLITAAVLLRRRDPVLSLFVTLAAPPVVRIVEFGLARDPSTAEAIRQTGTELSPYIDIFALAIIVYTLGVSLPSLEAGGWWFLAGVVAAGSTALFGNEENRVGDFVFFELLLLVALLIGMNVRSNRKRIEAVELRAQQLELEREQRDQLAVAGERTRIAREMHDVVAHSLTVMVTLADGALVSLDRNPAGARRAIEELGEAGRTALADTRRLVGVLRSDDGEPRGAVLPGGDSPSLAPQPGLADIRDLVERFRATGLDVRLTESGPPVPPDAGLHLAAYRIVQESLTNVLRHAPKSPGVEVRISRWHSKVVIEVENETDPDSKPHGAPGKGLIGMRERAAVYGGTVDTGATPSGWRVRAELYWQENS